MRVFIPAPMSSVTDVESLRYAMSGVHCQPVAGCGGKRCILSATDSRCLATIDTECDGVFEPCILPGKLFVKKTVGCWAESSDGQNWTVTVETRKGKETIHGETPEGRFPRISEIFPKFDDAIALKLDAKLLAKLADTLRSTEETSAITLVINRDAKTGMADSAIGVISAAGDCGLIMPISLEKHEKVWEHVSALENHAKHIARSWGGKIDRDGEVTGEPIEPVYVSPATELEVPTVMLDIAADVIAQHDEQVPVAHVSEAIADAFDMHDLPNTVVEPTAEPEADDPLADILAKFMSQLTA